MERAWRFFENIVSHPKTTAVGVAMIFGGVGMLQIGDKESIAAGVTAILTGLGFILSADGIVKPPNVKE